jgi:hypothetical protein
MQTNRNTFEKVADKITNNWLRIIGYYAIFLAFLHFWRWFMS